jgi:hypothetical protein
MAPSGVMERGLILHSLENFVSCFGRMVRERMVQSLWSKSLRMLLECSFFHNQETVGKSDVSYRLPLIDSDSVGPPSRQPMKGALELGLSLQPNASFFGYLTVLGEILYMRGGLQ